MIKAIIVDDEPHAIKNLRWEIGKFCEDVQVLDAFTDPLEAISAINYLKPDCVFLDVEMPEIDGFELLDALIFRDFDLIITSAHESYALNAFKENAIDYLLKPIDSDDLISAVDRIRSNKTRNDLGSELKNFLKNWQSLEPKRLILPLAGKTLYVSPEELLYCKSDGNYTEIYFTKGTREVFTKRLKDMEELLQDGFIRVHNSYIIRLSAVKEFVTQDGHSLILSDGTHIPVSRSRKQELLRQLNQ